jgi:predicted nucleic acid-binding protein
MTLLTDLPVGTAVGLDTPLFIYYLEDHPVYKPIVVPLLEDRVRQGLNGGITSLVTLAEVLVQPLRAGRTDLVSRFRDFLTGTPHLSLADITRPVANRAADFRARYRLRLPDAFQMAAALEHGAAFFVTNDIQLRRVTELTVLVLNDYLPPPPS